MEIACRHEPVLGRGETSRRAIRAIGLVVWLIMIFGCSAPGQVSKFPRGEPSYQISSRNDVLPIQSERVRLRGAVGDFRSEDGRHIFLWKAIDGARLEADSSIIFVWKAEANELLGRQVIPQLGLKPGLIAAQADDLRRTACEQLNNGPSGKGSTLENCLRKSLGEGPLKVYSAQIGFGTRPIVFERRGERIILVVPLADLLGDPLSYRVSPEQSASELVLRLWTGKDAPAAYRRAESRHIHSGWPLRDYAFEIPPPLAVFQVKL